MLRLKNNFQKPVILVRTGASLDAIDAGIDLDFDPILQEHRLEQCIASPTNTQIPPF